MLQGVSLMRIIFMMILGISFHSLFTQMSVDWFPMHWFVNLMGSFSLMGDPWKILSSKALPTKLKLSGKISTFGCYFCLWLYSELPYSGVWSFETKYGDKMAPISPETAFANAIKLVIIILFWIKIILPQMA